MVPANKPCSKLNLQALCPAFGLSDGITKLKEGLPGGRLRSPLDATVWRMKVSSCRLSGGLWLFAFGGGACLVHPPEITLALLEAHKLLVYSERETDIFRRETLANQDSFLLLPGKPRDGSASLLLSSDPDNGLDVTRQIWHRCRLWAVQLAQFLWKNPSGIQAWPETPRIVSTTFPGGIRGAVRPEISVQLVLMLDCSATGSPIPCLSTQKLV